MTSSGLLKTITLGGCCLLALLLCSEAVAVPCTPDDITLSSQAEVDGFQANHGPGCDTIVKSLTVTGASVTDLTPLSGLTTGAASPSWSTIAISETSVTSLAGLGNLTSAYKLDLINNISLADITALSSMNSLVGPLFIQSNSSLTNLNGLSGITNLPHGSLFVQDNPMLSDLSALSGLTSVGGSLVIRNNDSLQDLNGLNSLGNVNGSLQVMYNDGLLNIDALAGVSNFSGTFELRFNSKLVSIPDFTGWTDLNGLIVYFNSALTDLDGLAGLQTLGNQYNVLWIKSNASLTRLDGLADLVSIDAGLEVADNGRLADCSGLATVLDQNDDALPGPGPGLAGIPDIRTEVTIENNLPGCNSIGEITGVGPPPGFELIPQFGALYTHIGARSLANPDKSCDWSPGETVEIWWGKPDAKLAEFTVDAMGCFQGLFLPELDPATSLPGAHPVQARGSVSGVSNQDFEQVEPELHISPAQGAPGREVNASGCNWDGAASVEITWQEDSSVLDTLTVDGSGCINATVKFPRVKDGIYGLLADSDDGKQSAAAYQVFGPTIIFTPAEGPPDTSVPLDGRHWFPEEVIEFAFIEDNVVFDTAGTGTDGRITTGGVTEPTLYIPASTTFGEKTIRATGQNSGLTVNIPFVVRSPTLEFIPDNGKIGDPVTVTGCGWVSNETVTVEWGELDHNNLPIRWAASVDAETGCFGQNGELIIIVPPDTTTGPIENTATGNVGGEALGTFTVNNPGWVEVLNPNGYVGHAITLHFHDVIPGETLGVQGSGNPSSRVYVNAVQSDFTFDYTLPTAFNTNVTANVSVSGDKGFRGGVQVNILDNAEISVPEPADVRLGRPLKVEGRNWASYETVEFKLLQGSQEYPLYQDVRVAPNEIDFVTFLNLSNNLVPGDYVLLAEGTKGRDAELNVVIGLGPSASFTLGATFAEPPPDLDGVLSVGEWDYAQKVDLANGFISARSDDSRLYILLDLLGDSVKDALGSDNFWLSFDTTENLSIDAGFDLNFRLQGSDLILEEYTGPDSFAPRSSVNLRSAYASGYDCFTADNSARVTISGLNVTFVCDQHRVFEIGIDLQSINARPGEIVRVGVLAQSQVPTFSEEMPAGFPGDFGELGTILLADSQIGTSPPAGTVTGIGSNGFEIEVTQATQDVDNSLTLVADKPTAARVFPAVAGEAVVRAWLFGRRGGQDLPGSPLVTIATIPPTIDRNILADTANFLLPASWVTDGTIELMAIVENENGINTRVYLESFTFHERMVPDYWIVPVNSGTTASPTVVADGEISTQQSYLETVFPVHDVNWIRKDWTDLGAVPIGSKKAKDWLPDVNKELNDYYDDLVISHTTSLAESGQAPFDLPDQVYGFTAEGGGRSSPVWAGGSGVVGSGFYGTSGDLTMTHEINHNLDMSTSGTWGLHTTDADDDTDSVDWGCTAGGGNTDWPRSDDELGETGFDTRLPWQASGTPQVTVVPDNFPDYMSYCRSEGESNAVSGQLPFKWTSPYRWSKQFADFAPPFPGTGGAPLSQEDVYYISGVLQVAGTGNLDPIRIQPGTPTAIIAPGDYSLEIQTAGGVVLWSTSFYASFRTIEGEDVETVYFHFRLPLQENGAAVVLKHLGATLDTIVASVNPPTAMITAPAGGETWDGETTIQWTANDLDGDDLTFSLLYSPDNGDRWYPVARNLVDMEYTLDVSRLPGGGSGKIRLITTDGFHTVTVDSSGTFTIPDPSPTVVIESPLESQLIGPADRIPLRGSAHLPDGPGDNLLFVWSVDGELVATGAKSAIQLGEGVWPLTLDVYGDGEIHGTASILLVVDQNDPPNEPILPFPTNNAENVFVNSVLNWVGGDIDGDTVSYDVYLEADHTEPGVLVCEKVTLSACIPSGGLLPSTKYYWQVIAHDDQGETSEGEVWAFETGDQDTTEVIFLNGLE